MAFKYICIGLSIVAGIISVVISSGIQKEDTTPDFKKIANNISGVKKLLHAVLKSYTGFEKKATTDSVETDDNTDSENKESIETNTNNKEKNDSKITNKIKAFTNKSTPLYFSDRSSEKDDSGTEEKKTIGVRKINKNTHVSAKSTSARQPTDLKIRNQMKAKNYDDDTESSGDVSSNEKHRNDSPNIANPRKDTVKNIDIHVGITKSDVKSRASTVKEKHFSLSDPKISKPKEDVHDSQSKEDHIAMESDVLRAGYLRQAYDDACKQVVIRKCYKALRTVSKDVCSRDKKCSSKYKDDFRANGQAACNQEFNNQTSACRMGVESNKATAVDNLGAKDIINPKTSKTPDIQEVNVLRDRFEKICKKNSFDKCRAACKDASDKTCKEHECVKAKTKALKRFCKRRCQSAFGYHGDSGESDDDSDEDDDDEDDD